MFCMHVKVLQTVDLRGSVRHCPYCLLHKGRQWRQWRARITQQSHVDSSWRELHGALVSSVFAEIKLQLTFRGSLRTSLTPEPTYWESASLFILELNNSQLRIKQRNEDVLQKAMFTQIEMLEEVKFLLN